MLATDWTLLPIVEPLLNPSVYCRLLLIGTSIVSMHYGH